jgi:hypothetical protein
MKIFIKNLDLSANHGFIENYLALHKENLESHFEISNKQVCQKNCTKNFNNFINMKKNIFLLTQKNAERLQKSPHTFVSQHLSTMKNDNSNKQVQVVLRKRYKDITFRELYKGNSGGTVEIFNQGEQNKQEKSKNIDVLKLLADKGGRYRLLPIISDGNKNPDAFNLSTKKYVDIKVGVSKNGENVIKNALKKGNKQNINELILYITKKPNSYRKMYYAVKKGLENGYYKQIEQVTIIFPDKNIKIYDLNRIRYNIKRHLKSN